MTILNAQAQFVIPTLGLSTTQTASLVFPVAITHIEPGSAVILASTVASAPNVLLVKARQENFPATNLQVITVDGSVYAFPVIAEQAPKQLIHRLPGRGLQPPALSAWQMAQHVRQRPANKYSIRKRSAGLQLWLTGVYVYRDALYYQLRLRNDSPLNFSVDQVTAALQQRRRVRRTAEQQLNLEPLLLLGDQPGIGCQQERVLVLVLPKHSVGPDQLLELVLTEHSGRVISLRIPHANWLRAKVLE